MLLVESGKLGSNHLQCQFDRLKRIYTRRIFHPLGADTRYLKWTVLIIAERIGSGSGFPICTRILRPASFARTSLRVAITTPSESSFMEQY